MHSSEAGSKDNITAISVNHSAHYYSVPSWGSPDKKPGDETDHPILLARKYQRNSFFLTLLKCDYNDKEPGAALYPSRKGPTIVPNKEMKY